MLPYEICLLQYLASSQRAERKELQSVLLWKTLWTGQSGLKVSSVTTQ